MTVHPGSARGYALVGAGGAVGGLARYALVERFPEPAGVFPTTTLIINIVGSFALAVLIAGVVALPTAPSWLRPTLGTGLLGSFTTFSAIMRALDALSTSGHRGLAAWYLVATLVGGVGAAVLGVNLGEWWARRDAFRENEPAAESRAG